MKFILFYFLFCSFIFSSGALGQSQCVELFNSAPSGLLQSSQARLRAQWNILENMKDEKNILIKKQAMRVNREIMAVWALLGIDFEADVENKYNLLVSIPKDQASAAKAHPINRMAYAMSKNLRIKSAFSADAKPLRVGIDVYNLKKENAGALFNEEMPQLTLARDNVIQGAIDDMIIHEDRHAYNFYQFANGNDHDFTAWISNSEELPIIHETYPHTFSADELSAYTKQINLMIRSAIRQKTGFEDALDFIESGLKLAATANRPQVLSLSSQMLLSLRTHPENWSTGRWNQMEVEDRTRHVLVFSSSVYRTKIYFYEVPLLDNATEVNTRKVTHTVIDNGDYKLDMLTLNSLQIEKINALLQQVEKKVQGLSERLVNIEKYLLETQKALKADNSAAGLSSIQKASAYIGIK